MADRDETIKKGIDGLYFRVEFGDVTVSNADTVTLDGFSSTVNSDQPTGALIGSR